MVMFGPVEFWDSVMKLPATRANADDEAVLTVPVVVPPATLLIVCRMD